MSINDIRAKAEAARQAAKEAASQERIPLLDMDVGDEMVFRVDKIRASPFKNAKEGDVVYDVTDVRSADKDKYTFRTQKALMSNLEKAEITHEGDFGYLIREKDVEAKDSGFTYKNYTVVKLSDADVAEFMGKKPKK